VTGAAVAVLVCVGGGLGAGLRFVLDGLIRSRSSDRYPLATTVINLTGSLLLGLLTGLAGSHLLSHPGLLMLGAGLLGGYTTFSTASFETIQLLESRRYLAAAVNGFGTLLAASAAAALGYLLGLGSW
jgi:CrcB protein